MRQPAVELRASVARHTLAGACVVRADHVVILDPSTLIEPSETVERFPDHTSEETAPSRPRRSDG